MRSAMEMNLSMLSFYGTFPHAVKYAFRHKYVTIADELQSLRAPGGWGLYFHRLIAQQEMQVAQFAGSACGGNVQQSLFDVGCRGHATVG